MNIHTSNNSPEFGALHIASCGKIKLYKLTDSADMKFVKSMPDNIKMENLMPGLTKDEYSRWHEMLEYACDNAQKRENVTYLETVNNKLCGIITFTPDNITKLDCICTWPVEFGKKVKLAGQTLFYQMFKDFQNLKGKKIKLDAITNGPFNTVEKYTNLGFLKTSNIHPTKVEMEITTPKIKQTTQRLSNIIDYKPIEPQKVNLQHEVEI